MRFVWECKALKRASLAKVPLVAPGDDLAIIYKVRALHGQLLSHESIHLIDQNLLDELKSIIAQGQYQAYRAVDNIKVRTYWQLGERIVREELKYKNRAEYGQ